MDESKYVLHFAKREVPPAEAFWSVTMYDEAGFQVANPLNRFALGDRERRSGRHWMAVGCRRP